MISAKRCPCSSVLYAKWKIAPTLSFVASVGSLGARSNNTWLLPLTPGPVPRSRRLQQRRLPRRAPAPNRSIEQPTRLRQWLIKRLPSPRLLCNIRITAPWYRLKWRRKKAATSRRRCNLQRWNHQRVPFLSWSSRNRLPIRCPQLHHHRTFPLRNVLRVGLHCVPQTSTAVGAVSRSHYGRCHS